MKEMKRKRREKENTELILLQLSLHKVKIVNKRKLVFNALHCRRTNANVNLFFNKHFTSSHATSGVFIFVSFVFHPLACSIQISCMLLLGNTRKMMCVGCAVQAKKSLQYMIVWFVCLFILLKK